jgi:hypothetical protein
MSDKIKRYNPAIEARYDGAIENYNPAMSECELGKYVKWEDVIKEMIPKSDVEKIVKFAIELKDMPKAVVRPVPEIINIHKVYVNLYKNGDACVYRSKIDAQRAPTVLPERQGQFVETKVIEWEVGCEINNLGK